MQLDLFKKSLKNNGVPFSEKEVMKNHTTFKIGGKADIFVSPKDEERLIFTLKAAKETSVPAFILGNGSNLLVSDEGIAGAVIDMTSLCGIKVISNEIISGAGESLRKLCLAARDNSLSGLEFAYGIPGTVGGAMYMNAGAYGGEMADVTVSAVCLDKDYNRFEIPLEKMELSYRNSVFKTAGYIVLSVRFRLKQGDKDEINEVMKDIFKRRTDKQPLDFPSAGSTFKRPVGNYAGTLIEKAGLKGESVGGAMVSEKHAGFIINYDNATAKDVKSLIKKVKDTVYEQSGVNLAEEVIFIGR
ncbi:MAG: UDP-N-acetylmuramate dehydrogenase [Clostridia bacterium]|nr:UDP-N-acetylmuramate dehydrogenase [Clostridia bacterium]